MVKTLKKKYFFISFLHFYPKFQASSTLQSSQGSVYSAWTQIRRKTPSWSVGTPQAGSRCGTSVTLHLTTNTRWEGRYWYMHYKCTVFIGIHLSRSFYCAARGVASSAALLEGSSHNVTERGSPRVGRQLVRPLGVVRWLYVTVDERRWSRRSFRPGGGVEHKWSGYVPEVGTKKTFHIYIKLNSWQQN